MASSTKAEDSRQRRSHASIIASFGALLLSDLKPDEMLPQAAEAAAEGMDCRRAKVLEYRPDKDNLLVCAGVGWNDGVVGHATLGSDLRSPAGYAFRKEEAVAIEDVSEQDRFDIPEVLREHGIVALLNVPIRIDGFVYGVIEVDATKPRSFGPEDVNFLLGLAHLLAASIRRDMLRNEAREERERRERHAEQLRALADASIAITAAPTLQDVLQQITDSARAVVGAHQGITSLTRGPDWSQAITAVSLSDRYARWRDYERAPDGSGIYAYLCALNRPMRLTQAELEAHPAWRGFGDHASEHPPMRGWLAAPLVGRDGRNIGLLQLTDRDKGEFDSEDEAALVQLAQLASVAVERAQAEAALRETNERFQLAQAAAHVGVWDWNLLTDETSYTRECRRLYGWPEHEEVSVGQWLASLHPEDRERADRAVREPLTDGRPYEDEYRVVLPNGDVRWVSARGEVLRDSSGKPTRFIGVNLDVTDRKDREEHIGLLMRETLHRSKNQLMLIQVMARQSALASRSLEEFFARFSERLHGIAASQDLLVKKNWEGIALRDLIRSQVGHYVEDIAGRLLLEGPDVAIRPEPAQNLGLAFHELASNATKHGALSVKEGRVEVRWSMVLNEEAVSRFRLEWRERGGAGVRPPQSKGFGHLVMERIAPRAIDGTVKIEFSPEGLSWTLEGSPYYFIEPKPAAAPLVVALA